MLKKRCVRSASEEIFPRKARRRGAGQGKEDQNIHRLGSRPTFRMTRDLPGEVGHEEPEGGDEHALREGGKVWKMPVRRTAGVSLRSC